MGGEYEPLQGAIAEEAVPFPCAARRSFVLRCVSVVYLPMLSWGARRAALAICD